MSEQTTATVETLTAEVRVLMVGNRQVTLSVARQLDRCDLEDMEPFGRVKIGDEPRLVVGRHRETGALVLAQYRMQGPVPLLFDGNLSGKVVVCRASIPSEGEYRMRFDDRLIFIDKAVVAECQHADHRPYGSEECGHWSPNGHQAEIRAVISELDAAFEAHKRAASLPLIVLAGLR